MRHKATPDGSADEKPPEPGPEARKGGLTRAEKLARAKQFMFAKYTKTFARLAK
jgi:hypothetical protein